MTALSEIGRGRETRVQLSVWKGDMRLDRFLFRCGLFASVGVAKSRVDKGAVSINGIRSSLGSRVIKSTDIITVQTQQSNFTLAPLYEDNSVVVFDKPIGIESEAFWRLIKESNPEQSLDLVHRLDEDTSGIILFPKTKQATQLFLEMFRKRLMHKSYMALCHAPSAKQRKFPKGGIWKSRLALIAKTPFPRWGEVGVGGETALTHFEILDREEKIWKLRLKPETGRTHQLRVQTSQRGLPILGDRLYGNSFRDPEGLGDRLMLHAEEISFIHPVTGRKTLVKAPLPWNGTALLYR